MASDSQMGSLHREQQDPKERRTSNRRAFHAHADVSISDQHILPSHAVDISIGGIGLICSRELTQGQKIGVRFNLSACGLQRNVEIVGSVCFCLKVGEARYRVGLRFVHLDDDTAGFIEALCG